VLGFLAEHRLARVDHLMVCLGASGAAVAERLDALAALGLLAIRGAVFEGRPPAVQITRQGLGAIGSDLPTPRFDWRCYAHDVGVAWVWLAARAGAFGELQTVVAERRLRSRDGPGRRSDPPLAVQLGGVGPGGRERLHYPDLLLRTAEGARVAVELELTLKSRQRLEKILTGYGAAPNLDAVLYLVHKRGVGDAIARTARRLGISDRVMVQRCVTHDHVEPPEVDRVTMAARSSARVGVPRSMSEWEPTR
jgi:hypothetical protein